MSRRHRRRRGNGKGPFRLPRDLLGLWVATALGLTFLLTFSPFSSLVRVQEGEVSRYEVRAPRTVLYIDTQATERLRLEAARSVPKQYDVLPRPNEAEVEEVFDRIEEVVHDLTLPDMESKANRLEQELKVQLPPGLLLTVVGSSPEVLRELREQARSLFRRVAHRDLRDDTDDVPRAQAEVDRLLQEGPLQGWRAQLVGEILKQILRPNLLFNREKTEQKRREAEASVRPVQQRIMKGETILRPGERITRRHMDQLIALGLLQPRFDVFFFLALLLLVGLGVAWLGLSLQLYSSPSAEGRRRWMLVATLLLLAGFLQQIRWPAYGSLGVMAILSGGMVANLFLGPMVGLQVAFLLALLLGVASPEGAGLALQGGIGAGAGILATVRISKRSHVVQAGALVTLSTVLVAWGLSLLERAPGPEMLARIGWAGLNGMGSFFLLLALGPILERLFTMTTSFHLLELANPNEPLLRRLLAEAPGTYHASLIIGNLAEAAAEAIGADPLLTRAAAYYHDIGKLRRPYYFVENQFGEANIHERLSPAMSALVVKAHVKDGVEIAREYGLPQVIVDIIQQHHGTTLISFFYNQAVEQALSQGQDPSAVDESQFRYDGPKPQSKEAALIMLADAVEATVRSMQKVTPAKIEKAVEAIFRARLEEGQLDECNLTLKDLSLVKQSFIKNLQGIFHSRIEYPEGKAKKEPSDNARLPAEPATPPPAEAAIEAGGARGAEGGGAGEG